MMVKKKRSKRNVLLCGRSHSIAKIVGILQNELKPGVSYPPREIVKKVTANMFISELCPKQKSGSKESYRTVKAWRVADSIWRTHIAEMGALYAAIRSYCEFTGTPFLMVINTKTHCVKALQGAAMYWPFKFAQILKMVSTLRMGSNRAMGYSQGKIPAWQKIGYQEFGLTCSEAVKVLNQFIGDVMRSKLPMKEKKNYLRKLSSKFSCNLNIVS